MSDPNQPTPDSVNSATKFEADHRALAELDPLQDLVNSPESDMFPNGEPDESTLTPVFDRRSIVDDICSGGTTFEDCLATLSRLLARFAECRISISFTKSIFVQPESALALPRVFSCNRPTLYDGVHNTCSKFQRVQQSRSLYTDIVPVICIQLYQTTLELNASLMKSPSMELGQTRLSRFIQNMAVYGAVLYQLKDADFADGGDLAAAKSAFAELKTKVANAPIPASLRLGESSAHHAVRQRVGTQ
ncbi:unnamed protein product [Phytophthora fragariaefolia]|uniref:Unnamed protein product n=1 Tax=Phytophthora fragariaefolia TaxID=1490495 RepID=A0A9W6YGH6_9STRA|nr:unnamed protein product [Phytophthora fragariaefolia]